MVLHGASIQFEPPPTRNHDAALPPAPTLTTRRLVVGITTWGVLAAGALCALNFRASIPGPIKPPPAIAFTPAPAAPFTLFVAVHPRCPCSLATLENLASILPRCHGRVQCRVLLFQPAAPTAAWTSGPAWDALRRLPDTLIIPDTDGREAIRLGSLTSGAVVLYDADGHARFYGGLTASRGHPGDNPASNALASMILADGPAPAQPVTWPAFGCSLTDLDRVCTSSPCHSLTQAESALEPTPDCHH